MMYSRVPKYSNGFMAPVWLVAVIGILVACCSVPSEQKQTIGLAAMVNDNGRNDRWGFIGPGGGGAMFYPAINPADNDHAFVSCDMTGSFVTYDGGEKWRMFNLRGVTRFYSFDHANNNIVYAGTADLLFKSYDKGVSWHTIYPRPEEIVAINEQGDHAAEIVVTKDSILTELKKLVVDPDNAEKIYLLARKKQIYDWSHSKGSKSRFYSIILVSEDGGNSWQTMDKLRFDLNDIFIDPTSPIDRRTVYISGKDGLGVKINGSWGNVPLPNNAGPIGQFTDGYDKKNNQHIIYAVSGQSYFNPKGLKSDSKIFMTRNGGMDWSIVSDPLNKFKMEGAAAPEFRSLATSYFNPENIFVSYANLQISEDSISFGVAKSTDFGITWKLVWDDRNVSNHGSICAANRESGWLDQRFGPGWGENPFHMKVADHDPDVCFATDFGRTLKTVDGGKTWQQVYTNSSEAGWRSRGLQVTTGYLLAFDPFNSQHVFMADTDTGLMESRDGGKSWNSATYKNGVPNHWVNSTYWLLFDPEVKNKVWAVMSRNHDLPRPKMWRNSNMDDYEGGVLVSHDSGKSWEPTSSDIGETAPTHIIMDYRSDPENRILYVCAFGKGVYKSQDGGISWRIKNNGIEGEKPAAWRIYQKNDGVLYLVVFRKSDDGSIGNELDGALYRSSDGADSWIKMRLPEGVNGPSSLLFDQNNSNRIYLSAWGRFGDSAFAQDQGGGIYLSEDEGLSWNPVLTEDQHIHDLTLDDRNGTLYAAGFNSSAYRSDDQGYHWKRIKGYNFKWGKRVQPDPMDPEKIYIITFGGGVWHGPATGDEDALEDIVTPATAYN